MNAPLVWQLDVRQYVRQTASVYSMLAAGINRYCGELKGKTLLEIGCGFSLPHGGLDVALAVRDGARQCFGIDISNPNFVSPEKARFWEIAADELGVSFEHLDRLHTDEMYPRAVRLQMSASNMYFRDEMFDIAFSNAVFEHVKDMVGVLRELYRVLKPGGGCFHHWNPASGLEMGGHDVGIPFYYPWAHLRLSAERHAEKLHQVLTNPDLLESASPPAHTITPDRAAALARDPQLFRSQMMDDMNMVRIPELLETAKTIGFEVVHSGFHIRDNVRKYLTDDIRAELRGYSDDELLTNFHSFALRKPA